MVALLRALTFALQNFYRNLWLSVVTVVILALSVFFINALTGLKVAADQSLEQVKNRVEISVFFQPTAAEAEIDAVQARLEKLPEVKSVTYISKEQALEDFRVSIRGEEALEDSLSAIGINPLQASLIVRARDLDQYAQILTIINDPEYDDLILQDHVVDSKLTFIQRFSKLTQNLSRVGLGMTIIFAIIAALVVFNTIRITIYAYREEIGIMKLVGASNAFVRAPFIIESILYAVLAAIVALAVLWILLTALTPFLDRLLEGYDFALGKYLVNNFFVIFLPAVLWSVVLAVLSSAVAVGRYLRI